MYFNTSRIKSNDLACKNLMFNRLCKLSVGDSIAAAPIPRGGGTLIFSSYIGLDQASTVYLPPKKKQKEKKKNTKKTAISSTPKNIRNFCNPKKYSDSIHLP